jgi:hypothetical protein
MVKDPEHTPPEDVALVYGKDPETEAFHILRKRGEVIEAGSLRPLEHGKPVVGEVVSLEQRTEHPCLFNVSPLGKDTDATKIDPKVGPRCGPARVSNTRFRTGWDHIWGENDDDETIH